jgi:hypothetical protein
MSETISATVRTVAQQAWRDLLSVYYANTLTWRWLKSGALVFLGFFAWTGSSVLLSVEPGWGFLTYTMAYGFLLIAWGPFTHLVVVPVTIRLRRSATNPVTRWFSKNSGKVNLTVFFTLVVILAVTTPSFMMLEFSPDFSGGESTDFSGELVCNTGEDVVTCHVEDAQGIDSVEVRSGGETLVTAETAPFEFELPRSEINETPTGDEFRVIYYDADGNVLTRQIRSV